MSICIIININIHVFEYHSSVIYSFTVVIFKSIIYYVFININILNNTLNSLNINYSNYFYVERH